MPSNLAVNHTTMDDLSCALDSDLVKTYRTYYAIQEFDLPLTEAAFGAFFSNVINVFGGDPDARAVGVCSNTVISNSVDIPFLVRAIAVYVAVEAFGFTAAGGEFGASPFVPAYDGILEIISGTPVTPTSPPAAASAPTFAQTSPAWLEWGIPTWKAAHSFMQAYRVRMLLGGRLELFNELAADIGNMDSHSPWQGFSDSLVAIPEYVAHVNANGAANGRTTSFLPATAQTAVLPGDTAALPHVIGVPTPLVPGSWGGPIQEGLFCGAYPTRGLLLLPSMPINIAFVRDNCDVIYYNALHDALVDNPAVTYAAAFGSSSVAALGSGPVPVPSAPVASALFSKRVGGKMRIGLTLRGFELSPRCCLEWYGTYGGTYTSAYQNQFAMAALGEYAAREQLPGGLAGLPAWLEGGAGLKIDVADAEQA
jgi:hypothetical protein